MPVETFHKSNDPNKPETRLHEEASKHLSRPVRSLPPLKLDADGTVAITEGSSISRIALQCLAKRGESASGMKDEIDRIIALNVDKYPSLKLHPELIKTGWHLKVEGTPTNVADRSQPVIWQDAPKDRTTIVHKGQHVVAPESAYLIVEPGGEAVLNAGSKGFAAPGSLIKMAMPGSLVLAGGGEIHDYGARIYQDSHSPVQSKIVAEDINKLKPYQVAQQKADDVGPIRNRTKQEDSTMVAMNKEREGYSGSQVAMLYPDLHLFPSDK
jgi:hypothetical protein